VKDKYSLLIADDDDAIRNGMSNYIDWDSMGFYVAASFEDGKEMIEYLEKNHVDVVLTDIQMSENSGLDVARYIFEHHLNTKVIILSGYKEFEYARQAIAYNVEDYVLKPVNLDELYSIFSKIYQKLGEERREKEERISQKQDFDEMLPELQEQFWMSILLGVSGNREKIIERRETLGLHFSTRMPCAVLDVKIDLNGDSGQYYFLEKNNRYNLLNNLFSGETEGILFNPVYVGPDKLKMVAVTENAADISEFENKIIDLVKVKKKEAYVFIGLHFDAELEGVYPNMKDLTDHYALSNKAGLTGAAGYSSELSSACCKPENSHGEVRDGIYPAVAELSSKSVKPGLITHASSQKLGEVYNLIMNIIDSDNLKELDYLISTVFFELREEPLNYVRGVIMDLFSLLQARFMKMSQEMWVEARSHISYEKLSAAGSIEELRETCLIQIHQVLDVADRRKKDVSRSLTQKVKKYLDEHYEEDISLDVLSERYYVNSSYLSRLFRQEMGTTITDYLTNVRIEKAKELLLTGKYKIYEISEMTGYRSDKYFFRVFKQRTGMSPSEFLRSHIS